MSGMVALSPQNTPFSVTRAMARQVVAWYMDRAPEGGSGREEQDEEIDDDDEDDDEHDSPGSGPCATVGGQTRNNMARQNA